MEFNLSTKKNIMRFASGKIRLNNIIPWTDEIKGVVHSNLQPSSLECGLKTLKTLHAS